MRGEYGHAFPPVEDILANMKPELPEYILRIAYYPHCRKFVDFPMETILPKTRIDHHLAALTAV
jgi:hypothetical protein